ncbi:FHA domain-containing protein [Schlesneria sp.]|uniref:FHA domain-containing protein n=1 Tax=Schlesneria sp. TaxID=2762018 RepID=UPI002EFB693E
MLGFLVPVGGGDPIPLLKPQLIVGRRPSCDIRLDFANVSSHHCRLEYINGYWRATDLSRNGTKVNGERIEERFLQSGDTLAFARHPFEIQYTPDPNGVPPTIEDVDPFEMSLLEKAGLDVGRSSKRKQPPQRPPAPSYPLPSPDAITPPTIRLTDGPARKTDDDQALEWLNES